jgi:hypothetical protein
MFEGRVAKFRVVLPPKRVIADPGWIGTEPTSFIVAASALALSC